MTHFQWTPEQRAQVVPGATVVLSGFVSHTVTVAGKTDDFIQLFIDGRVIDYPWSRVDPQTLKSNKQLDMFGGKS